VGKINDTEKQVHPGGPSKNVAVLQKERRAYEKLAVLAARMYVVDGKDYDEISAELGITKRLLKKWAKEGKGNGAVPWEEARNIAVARVSSATAEVEIERLKEEAREAIHLLMNRLREGKARAKFDDLPAIARFLLELENLDSQKLEFMRRFLREVARILARHIKDPRTLMLVSTELDALVDRFAKEMISVDKWIK